MLDTVIGVVLGQLILVLPFSIWMLKGYFDNIPVDIDDSARLDGCNVFQRLFYIILPLGAPGIMVASSNEYLLRVTAVGNVCRYIRVRTDWSYVGTPYETHLPACHSDGEKRHCGLI